MDHTPHLVSFQLTFSESRATETDVSLSFFFLAGQIDVRLVSNFELMANLSR